jgi:hypothetical protein
MLAPHAWIAGVNGTGIVVIAEGRVLVTRVNRAILDARPVLVTATLVRADTLATVVAFAQVSAVEHDTGDAADAFPAGIATTRVGPDAFAVVAVPHVVAMKLVAVLSLPPGVAKAEPLEFAAYAVLTFAVVLPIGVIIFVVVVVEAVAIIILVFVVVLSVAVVVDVLVIGLTVPVDVVVRAVLHSVSVHVGIDGVRDAVAVDISALARIEWVGSILDFLEVAGAVAVAVP